MIRTRYTVLIALALIIGLVAVIFGATRLHDAHIDSIPPDEAVSADEAAMQFAKAMEQAVSTKRGMKVEGLTPEDIMEALPKIIPDDFNGVEAVLGEYQMVEGRLELVSEDSVGGAAGDITPVGYGTLRTAVYQRLNLDLRMDAGEVVKELQTENIVRTPSEIPPATEAGTICPQDAKICPDGSSVGREGLSCEFAACPGEGIDAGASITCQPDQRLVDMCTEQYQPVCAAYQVQCIKAPCNPVPKTYGNSCFACMDKNVISYTAGACTSE